MFTKADIEQYFYGEKGESRIFLLIGILALLTALLFMLYGKSRFYTGAAIPLVAVGLLLAIVGYTIYKRSDNDRIRNVYAYDMNPAELKEKEIPRMKTVMRNFVIYRYTELLLAIIGIGLYVYFIRDFNNDFWRGFGLALAFMALTALIADYFAEQRGKKYLRGLVEFCKENK
jgi:Ca2+/Na+ antiporter